MGGGSYSYMNSHSRGVSYQSQTREEVFKQREMNKEMDIKGKIREARDSEEHPTSLPIIISLDVTGSMGVIPEYLIKFGFPEIMKKIMDEGTEHPQVCFLGIGDHYTDIAPIQVGQFESSDELLDKWLKIIWLEGHGGGNGGESYSLAWYFAARHTSIDSLLKRGQKGILITIGDEPCHGSLSCDSIKKLFGDTLEGVRDIEASQILKEAQESWHVYHINLQDYMGRKPSVQEGWKKYLGERVINTEDGNGVDIPDIISGIILGAVNIDKMKVSVETGRIPSGSETKETTNHLR